MATTQPANSPNYALMGFLAAAIAVLGMLGVMATYVAPLPLERAMAREAVLDAAQAALAGPDPEQAISLLMPQLGDSAQAILPVGPQTAAKITAERAAMRGRLMDESRNSALRLRLMIVVASLATALFGALAIHGARRR